MSEEQLNKIEKKIDNLEDKLDMLRALIIAMKSKTIKDWEWR